jgi:hypothetical protein
MLAGDYGRERAMIAARQIAFGRGGKRKPYDAEIEYLESTGTQYINTGMIPSSTCKFIIDAWFTKRTQFGSMAGGSNRFHAYNPFCVKWEYLGDTVAFPYGRRAVVTLNNKTGYFLSGDISISYPPMLESGAPEFFLFAQNNAGSLRYFDVGARIYAFDWWDDADTEKSMSFIPVRKGNIGYMYDRVSGQLFGNQGTGEFVLGPDIIDYTAKDYIQDGLVAMWDGIENAGWGVHDSNAIVWKDLVGDGDFPVGSNSFMEDYLRVDEKVDNKIPWNGLLYGDQYTIEVAGFSDETYKSIATLPGTDIGAGFVPYSNWGPSNSYVLHCGARTVIANTGPVGTRKCFGIAVNLNDYKLYSTTSNYVKDGTWIKNETEYKGSIEVGGRTNFIRFYNRALTAEEIAYNYEIDKARFGL